VQEEIGSTATGVDVVITAFAAIAVTIKVTLALFVELSGGISTRHSSKGAMRGTAAGKTNEQAACGSGGVEER